MEQVLTSSGMEQVPSFGDGPQPGTWGVYHDPAETVVWGGNVGVGFSVTLDALRHELSQLIQNSLSLRSSLIFRNSLSPWQRSEPLLTICI